MCVWERERNYLVISDKMSENEATMSQSNWNEIYVKLRKLPYKEKLSVILIKFY